MDTLQKRILAAAGILLAVMIIIMTIAIINRPKEEAVFTPPPFEENAIAGMPENVDEALLYNKLEMRDGFVVHLCVFPSVTDDGQALLYFTSDESNEFYVRIQILTDNGRQIGETGMLKPGEYIDYVSLDEVPDDGDTLSLKVLSYEPDTYYSMGTAKINVTAKRN